MPYKNSADRNWWNRCYNRSRRYPAWRQAFTDCGGMCIWPSNGSICGQLEGLEFHEHFGEDHKGDGRMQQRITLCPPHHFEAHAGFYNVESNPNRSYVADDVAREMEKCGSQEAWAEHFHVDLSRTGSMLGALRVQHDAS